MTRLAVAMLLLFMTFDSLPGGTLIGRGLDDIIAGTMTEAALLVMIGAPRLRRLGLIVPPNGPLDPESELYNRLAAAGADSAHSRYNAMIRMLVSFESALAQTRSSDIARGTAELTSL